MTEPSTPQQPTLDPKVFCAGTIEIVRGNVPRIVQHLMATGELIEETPSDVREVLRPHVAGLVETGLVLGRRLLRAVNLALCTLRLRAEEVESDDAAELRDELLDLADELTCLLMRLSTVDAQFDRVD